MAVCPICKKPAKERAENVAFPFCAPRCKMIDLGAWATESYRIPVEEDDDAPQDEASGGLPPSERQ